ncbi:MAG: CNNM domain-containing protein [Nanoarchaeota archaeon]
MALIHYVLVVALISLSALFSGLTLGLMTLNPFDLKRKMRLGNVNAAKVYPVRRQGNLLLVTLLLGNVAVNSALAVFLGSLTSGLLASLLATGLIVLFGEILPQAVFSRYALRIGARMVWLVKIFIVIMYPVAKPIAKVLDISLGGELPRLYSKKEFSMIIQEQIDHGTSGFAQHEAEIIKGGLSYSEKKVKDIMTPFGKVFCLDATAMFTKDLLLAIHKEGYSRIPVYAGEKAAIIGVLFTKDLAIVDPDTGVSVRDVMRKRVFSIKDDDRLDRILKVFSDQRTHILMVRDAQRQVTGIITLEDVLEEIVGDILDEYDSLEDATVKKA